jgi:hypothetical protein
VRDQQPTSSQVTQPQQPARAYPHPIAPGFADFFAGLADHRLRIRCCTRCSARQWPPRLWCARCGGDDFGQADLDGLGVVHTFTVVHRGFDAWFSTRVPYGIVIADVGQGIRLTGNYLGADLERLRCGLPVRARYEIVDGRAYLGWAPAQAAEGEPGPAS